MASFLSSPLRRAGAPTLFSKLLNPVRSATLAPSLYRSFNTNTQSAKDDDKRSVDVKCRSDRSLSRHPDSTPAIFSDAVFDPFSPTRSLSQVLNWMDQLMEAPFVGSGTSGTSGVWRRGWDVKEDENFLHLRIDMPGLSKDDVKVSMEHNNLIIKGEAKQDDQEEEDGSGRRRYSIRLDLSPIVYKLDSIKARMKDGVLKLVIPKVKDEEKQKHVRQVQIE
ncbi:Small heat shock protein HSP [Trema orientale]|uniref:Small heat shock protein HSP n=1 Tax=Trema orientale TaxID=63057 RepID=A0A2P5F5D8_TREOI|nr:Small heat shock protein HSP [Trema orientale]